MLSPLPPFNENSSYSMSESVRKTRFLTFTGRWALVFNTFISSSIATPPVYSPPPLKTTLNINHALHDPQPPRCPHSRFCFSSSKGKLNRFLTTLTVPDPRFLSPTPGVFWSFSSECPPWSRGIWRLKNMGIVGGRFLLLPRRQ